MFKSIFLEPRTTQAWEARKTKNIDDLRAHAVLTFSVFISRTKEEDFIGRKVRDHYFHR